VVRAAGS